MFRDEDLQVPTTSTSNANKPMHSMSRAIHVLPASVARGTSAALTEGAFTRHPTRIQITTTRLTTPMTHTVKTYYLKEGKQINPRTHEELEVNEDRIGIGYMPSRLQTDRLLTGVEKAKYDQLWSAFNQHETTLAEIPRAILKKYLYPDSTDIPANTPDVQPWQRRQIQIGRSIDWAIAEHATGLLLSDSIFAAPGQNGFIIPSVVQFTVSGAQSTDLLKVVSTLAQHMPNLDTVYIIAGTNDILNGQGNKYEMGMMKEGEEATVAGFLVRRLQALNSKQMWKYRAPKVRKVFVCIPFTRAISIHATERNRKRVYNLNLVFNIASDTLMHENDITDGDAIAKYVHSKFMFQSTPDGIHIQPMETPAAICALDEEIAKLRGPETQRDAHFKQITYNKVASYQVFVSSRMRSIVMDLNIGKMASKTERSNAYDTMRTEGYSMSTKLILQSKVEINTELPMDACKLIASNETRQKIVFFSNTRKHPEMKYARNSLYSISSTQDWRDTFSTSSKPCLNLRAVKQNSSAYGRRSYLRSANRTV